MGITIKKITTLEEMLPNYGLIIQLSPQLQENEYHRLLTQMVPHNYYQAAAYEGQACIAVSGYWLGTKLYSGKYMEVDNFVVGENYRSRGVGKLLLDWMIEEAKAQACKTVMLDAYVENFKAHHFYYREGFIARGFHYIRSLA